VYDLSGGAVYNDRHGDPCMTSISRSVTIDALGVLCAQLTRGLFAIAKFLVFLRQPRLSGGILFSTCPSVRSSVRPSVNGPLPNM